MLENGDIIIRQATADDLAKIVSFTYAIHKQEDDQSIPAHANFLVNLEKWLKQEISNSLSLTLIAETLNAKNNKAIGFISASTIINDNGFLDNPTKGVVNLLWVEKEYRKKHIAKRLLVNIENCFVENAVTLVECSFTVNNNLANDFWIKSGYKIHSVIARKFLSNC